MGFDNSTRDQSLVGTPGKPANRFADGDSMIRVELDQPKRSDALTPGRP